MATRFSIYEAKARFSELIAMVRQGRRIRITFRGQEVAEIAPINPSVSELEARMRYLEETGRLQPAARCDVEDMSPVNVVPGALSTFLEERE